MKILPLAKAIIVLGILIVFSGCTGSVGHSIEITLISDPMIFSSSLKGCPHFGHVPP